MSDEQMMAWADDCLSLPADYVYRAGALWDVAQGAKASITENARLRARVAELQKFVSQAYCIAGDAQAMATVRYNASPLFSPMPELKELEDAASKLLEKPQ